MNGTYLLASLAMKQFAMEEITLFDRCIIKLNSAPAKVKEDLGRDSFFLDETILTSISCETGDPTKQSLNTVVDLHEKMKLSSNNAVCRFYKMQV